MEKKDYEFFLEHINGLLIIDKDEKLIYMNDQCADYIHVDREKSIGKPIKEVFPPTVMPDVLKGKKAYDTHIYFDDGRMSVSSEAQLRKNGEVVGVLEYDMVQDVESMDALIASYSSEMQKEIELYRQQQRDFQRTRYSIRNIIGRSAAVRELRRQIELAASTRSTVLITGETGTGKELVAHAIHNLSARAFNEFVKINSAGIPAHLFESELFGYEEGSFTGAKKGGRKGKFLLADKGTLFLDEVNQMPPEIQPKLLRVLQEREIDTIGGDKSIPVDVRIIAATNQDLRKMVREHAFREDLYYRLNVFPIHVPPLRERIEDIEELVSTQIAALNLQYGKNIVGVAPEVYARFRRYDWPGNVRELFNLVERMVTLSREETLTGELLEMVWPRGVDPDAVVDRILAENDDENLITRTRNEAEKELLIRMLKRFKGNKTRTAEYLKIARPLLHQKIRRLGIQAEDYEV